MLSNKQYIEHYEVKVAEYKRNVEELKELVSLALNDETRARQQAMLEDQEDTLKYLQGKLDWAKETLTY